MLRLNSWLLKKSIRARRTLPIRRAAVRLSIQPLEERMLLTNMAVHGVLPFAVGSPAGQEPRVSIYDSATGVLQTSFLAYDASFTGGVRVALADLNNDNVPDIVTAPGAGMAPIIEVFDGATGKLVSSFDAFDPGFLGGVTLDAGNIGNGRSGILVGAGPGADPHVETFTEGGTLIRSFDAFAPAFRGGVSVALGMSSAGHVTAVVGSGAGAAPSAVVYDLRTMSFAQTLTPFTPDYTGGIQVAAGDLTGDGTTDVIVDPLDAPDVHIQAFDGRTGQTLDNFEATGLDPGTSAQIAFTQRSGEPLIAVVGANGGAAQSYLFEGAPDPDSQIPALVASYPPTDGGGGVQPQFGLPGMTICATADFTVPGGFITRIEPGSECANSLTNDLSCGTKVSDQGGVGAKPSDASQNGAVRLVNGDISMNAADLSSDGFGDSWGLTRTWTNNILAIGGDFFGSGWTTTQNPGLTETSNGATIQVVSNGNNIVDFDKQSDGSYVERYDGRSLLTYSATTLKFTLVDESNSTYTFSGFDSSIPTYEQGQFQSETDAAGTTTQVTSETSNGTIGEIQRTIGSGSSAETESYLYSYVASGTNAGLVSQVTERRNVGGGTWNTVRVATYTYYDGTTSGGNAGDLELAQVEDASGVVLDTDYYRYYTSGESNGVQHGLEFALGSDSYARLAAAYSSPTSVSDSVLAGYADNYYQYDDNYRVSEAVTQGTGCTSCAGGFGTDTFSYTSSSNGAGYNSWHMKTVETLADGNEQTTYSNAYGQTMLSVYEDTTTDQQWCTFTKYDSAGRAILTANPSAVTGYSEGYADLLNYGGDDGGGYQYLSGSSGLISTQSFGSSTTATGTAAGDIAGYLSGTAIQQGQYGTPVPQSAMTYFDRVENGNDTAFTATSTQYRNTDGTGAETTSIAYTWQGSTAQVATSVTSLPVVSSTQNGPGTADTSTNVYDNLGRVIWSKDADGYLTYTAYDDLTGAVVKTITDVDTTMTSEFANLPSGWSTPTGGGLNLVTTFQVDILGRTTEMTHPNGDVDYTTYDDVDHEVRTYDGWNSATNLPTGPTMVTREDRPDSYTESLTMSATPVVSSGRPTGTEAVSGVLSLQRDITNDANQLVESDAYFNLSGTAYATSTYLGAAGTNYYATQSFYDHRGWLEKTVSPTGTITRTEYDGLGRKVSEWVGTDDTPASGYWSPTNNTAPSNMVMTASYAYDGGGVGDGDQTSMIQYPGGGATNRETDTFYDWRDRAVATKSGVQSTESTSVHRPITYVTYDNLGETTETQSYDGDGVTISSTAGVPNSPSSTLLRVQTQTLFDNQGRAYQSKTYDVNPSTGSVSSTALTTNTYYDHRGDVIETSNPGGVVQKNSFDGAGRQTVAYTTDGGSGSSWSNAGTVSGDIVLDQQETTYDANGNVILTADRQRFDSATGTGALGSPSSGIGARVYYSASYYDAADRLTANVDVGTNGGTAYTRPSTIPTRSDTALVTSQDYDANGDVEDVIDPRGLDMRTYYDLLSRKTETIEDYTDGTPTNETNKTTEYGYNSAGMTSLTAVAASGGSSETTAWIYGVSPSTGSAIASNDIVGVTEYPDPTSGAASSSQAESVTVNALGQTLTMQDRNGNIHTYSYDVLGRMTADAVTTLGSGVDGSVLRRETAYDTQGNAYLFTTYNSASGGSIVNQVEDIYDGLDQLTGEYQSHAGAITTSSPEVQYAYTEMASGANNSRMISMTYPDGYILDYNYSSGLNDSISRLSSLSDSTGPIESYSYLGMSTVVLRAHPQSGVDLTYIKQSEESNGDAGDQYTGLDRFGRVVDQRWINSSSTAVDRYQYGYDRDGNVLYKDNLVDSALGEVYSYDGLNQITSFARGTLNSMRTAVSGTASASQSWTYDAQGNMLDVTTNGTAQTRTANAQNEITSIGSASAPGYDANGNTTADENGNAFVYDAWNMLVKVKNSGGTVIATYADDAEGRRVTDTEAGTTTDRYFSAAWQMINEKVGSGYINRYVWSAEYVDAMVLRDSSVGGTLNQRIYSAQDADYNTTALISSGGSVLERYDYTPFGVVGVLSASEGIISGSGYAWKFYHQGGEEGETGLYLFRNREYSATLERWMQNDPSGISGGIALYMGLNNSPINALDSLGLKVELTAVNESSKVGPCGGYNWTIKWQLAAGKQGDDLDGYIIQEIKIVSRASDCKGKSIERFPANKARTFWERWPVVGGKMAPRAGDPPLYDTFAHAGSGECTEGDEVIQAAAAFYSSKSLIESKWFSTFKRDNDDANAGSLYSTESSKPDEIRPAQSNWAVRIFHMVWNCCPNGVRKNYSIETTVDAGGYRQHVTPEE